MQICFDIGQIVYLRTDPDQLARMVTSINISPNGAMYELACGTVVTRHFQIEISPERDQLQAMGVSGKFNFN